MILNPPVSFLFSFVLAWATPVVAQDYSALNARAKAFVEETLQISSDSPSAPVRVTPDLPFLGFYNRHDQSIHVSPRLNPIELQLTLVHEQIHVIRERYNPNEAVWLEEGIAKVMEFLYSGVWPVSYESFFRDNSSFCLSNAKTEFTPGSIDYATSFYFVYYLYLHLGKNTFLRELVTSPLTGWDNILTAARKLQMAGSHAIPPEWLNKQSLVRHFAMAFVENNRFHARFSLLFLHSFHKYSIPNQSSPARCPGDSEIAITYSREPLPPTAETWSVFHNPFTILASPTQPGSPSAAPVSPPRMPSYFVSIQGI